MEAERAAIEARRKTLEAQIREAEQCAGIKREPSPIIVRHAKSLVIDLTLDED